MTESEKIGLTAVVWPWIYSGVQVTRKETTMFGNEQDRVNYFNNLNNQASRKAKKLMWIPATKRIEPVGYYEPNPYGLEITPSDMKHAGG